MTVGLLTLPWVLCATAVLHSRHAAPAVAARLGIAASWADLAMLLVQVAIKEGNGPVKSVTLMAALMPAALVVGCQTELQRWAVLLAALCAALNLQVVMRMLPRTFTCGEVVVVSQVGIFKVEGEFTSMRPQIA